MSRADRLSGWGLYALAWVPGAILYAVVLTAQRRTSFAYSLLSGVMAMGVAALLGVGVWWLSGRLALPTRRRLAFYALHLVLAAVYSGVWLGLQLTWLRLAAGLDVTREVIRAAAGWQVLWGVWLYGLLAGVSYAIRAQRLLREEQIALARAEALAAQAQLRALRAQLNPHFLFNALHSLTTLVRHTPAMAEQALERLGDMLRYALDQGEQELVYLGDEWVFTQNYIDVERLRLGERLHVVAAIADDAADCLVPPFLLQPLVENAVRHGVAVRAEGGTVHLDARCEGETLRVEVRDDGPGTDPARVAAAQGLGLRTLRQQIEARYGARARFLVDTAPGTGFRVVVELPLEAAAGHGDAAP